MTKNQKFNLLNQITISDRQKETQKIRVFNAQSIVEPCNYTKQATQIEFKDDIIMEILSKLPVRYLVQFKCVSKLWNTLISDPYFTKKHLNDPHSQKLLFYQCNPMDFTSSLYSCPISSSKLVD
ncbi:hypothetical protein H5410_053648 [Solanum commersonii]|uniref:F-box domain-containing protein n=1 Tax=Solanum commersonii TaxID=4109 RepID=A0A9J5X6G4_SOLCO|nr:hypothetical protein H5410_053648 [Solanum commersonii]